MTDTTIVENSGWLGGWFKWCPTSMYALQAAERKLLSYLKKPYSGKYVDVGNWNNKKLNQIWTVILNSNKNNNDQIAANQEVDGKLAANEKAAMPLVLIHGFGAGVGLWIMNLEPLSSNRTVYAFDMLGFGRSSRPTFSVDALEAEGQIVQSIEDWRKTLDIDKFILLGHSMGGFVATSYAITYPERVAHLVLADPWGFQEKPSDKSGYQLPTWVRAVVTLLQPFNPLAGLRAAGPWGPTLVDRMRPDLKRKFAAVVEDTDSIPTYIYHCNAQRPSGETAFKTMTSDYGWAKYPMLERIHNLKSDVPITLIYGSRSWLDRQTGYQIKNIRKESYVDVNVIQGAGHHVYADKADKFNSIVQAVCDTTDVKSRKINLDGMVDEPVDQNDSGMGESLRRTPDPVGDTRDSR